MNRFRNFSIIFLIVLPVAILAVIRTTSRDHFKFNARNLAEASFSQSNTKLWNQVAALTAESLIIDLSDKGNLLKTHPKHAVNIPYRLLLDKASQKVIREFKGTVLLYSDEPGTSAKAWMLLSELGYRNIYILTDTPDNEVMKYKFRPDTTRAGTAL